MFSFDFELLLTGFADPVVLTVNERVVVNALAVIVCAQIALHDSGILSGFILARAFERNARTSGTRHDAAVTSTLIFFILKVPIARARLLQSRRSHAYQ
jgi:hypothetical protein